jgi:D-3-phosphoglycerate dehydrogenase
MMRILLAGDGFIRNDDLRAAIVNAGVDADFSELTLPWPLVPFGPIAEVDEASGREDAVAAAAADCEVVVTQMAPITGAVIAAAPKLRLVVCTRGGPVNVNLSAAAKRGIQVSSTPGRNAVAAAEYTLLLMLAAMRGLPVAHNSVVAGLWRSDLYAFDEAGAEIAGSTVGLIGFGEIGRRVAELVQAMGATVLAYDPFIAAGSTDGVVLTDLADLLARSDVVSLHARLTADTAGMIGAREFALMKRGAVFVNTARGGLLDYVAAERALDDGILRALALDVYDEEPVSSNASLLCSSNVVLSPHLAGATRQTAQRAVQMAAAEVARFAAGEPLLYASGGYTATVPS